MHKNEREIYIVLASEVDTILCTFCKFYKCYGCCCDAGDSECTHKLSYRLEDQWGGMYYGIEPGCDCWGFRPDLSVQDVADIVGIILIKEWDTWAYEKNKTGIKVYGREYEG